MKNKTNYLFLFTLSLTICVFYSQVNYNYLKKKDSKLLVHNATVYCIDNSWYLPQIKNYLCCNTFTSDINQPKYNVRRTPIYPIFYGIHYLIFGEVDSFFYIKISQILLFVFASLALFNGVLIFFNSYKISFLSFLIFILHPILPIYTSYTITESLFPALLGFSIYFLARCYKSNSWVDWFLLSIILSISILTRPLIILIAPSILYFIYIKNKESFYLFLKKLFFFSIGCIMIFGPWVVRNYIVSNGEFILLEKYYKDPMDYGISNIEFRKWISTVTNPANCSSEIISNKIIKDINNNIPKSETITNVLKFLDKSILENYSTKESYLQVCNLYDYYYEIKQLPLKKDSLDAVYSKKISKKSNSFSENHLFKYYVITPLLFIKSILFQSNTHNVNFLENYKSSIFLVFYKTILFIINLVSFISLFYLIFKKETRDFGVFIFLFVFFTFVYLIYIARYFEARYLVPLLPFLFISLSVLLIDLHYKFMNKK